MNDTYSEPSRSAIFRIHITSQHIPGQRERERGKQKKYKTKNGWTSKKKKK
jgi:hypothetical protein